MDSDLLGSDMYWIDSLLLLLLFLWYFYPSVSFSRNTWAHVRQALCATLLLSYCCSTVEAAKSMAESQRVRRVRATSRFRLICTSASYPRHSVALKKQTDYSCFDLNSAICFVSGKRASKVNQQTKGKVRVSLRDSAVEEGTDEWATSQPVYFRHYSSYRVPPSPPRTDSKKCNNGIPF